MRKGDARRQAIVETAERLFYENGYEHTSVQDVLDAMNMSKGGFYHHFESKMALLEAICEQRCESGYQLCEASVNACRGNAIDKLNTMFAAGFFFGQSSMDFVGLMVRVIYRDGSVQLKDTLQRATVRLYLPLVTRIVFEGIDNKLFYSAHPEGVSRIILMLNNCMTDEVANAISRARDENGEADILELISAYRNAIELLLNAPYGQIRMLELEHAAEIIRGMATQDKRMSRQAI